MSVVSIEYIDFAEDPWQPQPQSPPQPKAKEAPAPGYASATADAILSQAFSREAQDQARYTALRDAMQEMAQTIRASCIPDARPSLSPEDQQRRLSEACHAATRRCATMDYVSRKP